MLSLSNLRLENWRNFNLIDLEVPDRCFLFGPNGSGKSNLLDSLLFLKDYSTLGGGLEEAIEIRGGLKEIGCLSVQGNGPIKLEIKLSRKGVPHYKYLLKIEGSRQNRCRILEEYFCSLKHTKKEDSISLTELKKNFQSFQFLNVVPQLIRLGSSSKPFSNFPDPYGADLIYQISSLSQSRRETLLKKLNPLLKLAFPELEKLNFQNLTGRHPHLEATFSHWVNPNTCQDERQLSDGTLRLITLLWTAQLEGGTLMLEEPELSLHPEIVRILPSLIQKALPQKGKQVLYSTHSPDLLNDPGIHPDEIFLFKTGPLGTLITKASAIPQIMNLIETGFPLSEMVMSYTSPVYKGNH